MRELIRKATLEGEKQQSAASLILRENATPLTAAINHSDWQRPPRDPLPDVYSQDEERRPPKSIPAASRLDRRKGSISSSTGPQTVVLPTSRRSHKDRDYPDRWRSTNGLSNSEQLGAQV